MSKLVLVEEASGARHEVRPGDVLGRSGCEVVLDDVEISRNHARIHNLDTGPAIEDLGSTNGTSLNGHKLTGTAGIKDGDELKLGNTALRVVLEAAVDATRAAPAPAPPTPEPPAPTPAPEPAAAPQPPAADGSRGDVPAPEPAAASRVHDPLVVPSAQAAGVPFQSPDAATGSRGSAATRVEATAAAYAATLLTAIGVILFLAGRAT